jgi:hypothetical protein
MQASPRAHAGSQRVPCLRFSSRCAPETEIYKHSASTVSMMPVPDMPVIAESCRARRRVRGTLQETTILSLYYVRDVELSVSAFPERSARVSSLAGSRPQVPGLGPGDAGAVAARLDVVDQCHARFVRPGGYPSGISGLFIWIWLRPEPVLRDLLGKEWDELLKSKRNIALC